MNGIVSAKYNIQLALFRSGERGDDHDSAFNELLVT